MAQNIDDLFAGAEMLENEFDELYASLFEHQELYLAIAPRGPRSPSFPRLKTNMASPAGG